MNAFISQLIAKGNANPAHFIGNGGLTRLFIPDKKGVIIYRITVSAFADLAPGVLFSTSPILVGNFSWHQLRVRHSKGAQFFNMRHELSSVFTPTLIPFTIPVGKHVFDTWIQCQQPDVLFELTHAPQVTAWIATIDNLPATVNNDAPPAGYGNAGKPGSFTAVNHLRYTALSEYKAFGNVNLPFPGTNISRDTFTWDTNALSILNNPQPTIPFGHLTFPVIQVDYLEVNKNPDGTLAITF
jgi:hypothetical protein